jgi:hypothetical protein
MTIDGPTRDLWKSNQADLGIPSSGQDGLPGKVTAAAVRRLIEGPGRELASEPIKPTAAPAKKPDGSAIPIPRDNDAELIAVYGAPGVKNGRSPDLVKIDFPYPMKLSWAPFTPVASNSVHRLAKDDLLAILTEIGERYTASEREFLGLDLFGGIYNPRKRTGGSRMSTHAWGIAIDLDIARNRYGQAWSPAHAAAPGRPARGGNAWMPLEVVKIFERHGWVAGARWTTADAMHFQRAR